MKKYLFILILCAVPRLAAMFTYGLTESSGGNYLYLSLSDSLMRYGVFGFNGHASTFYEPLYPLFLTVSRFVFGSSALWVLFPQILTASVGGLFLYGLTYRLTGNSRTANIAVLLYAFYPYAVRQSVAVMEVTLLATCLLGMCYFYCRKNAFFAGIFAGLGVLTRSAILPIVFLGLSGWIAKKKFREAGIFTVAFLLLWAPWAIRNFSVDGSLLASRSGHNLFLSNCQYTRQLLPWYSMDVLDPYVHNVLETERPDLVPPDRKDVLMFYAYKNPEKDVFFRKKSLEFMRSHPIETLKIRLMSFFYLFSPVILPIHSIDAQGQLVLKPDGQIFVRGHAAHRSLWIEMAYAFSYLFIFLTAFRGMYLRRKEWELEKILYFIWIGFAAVYSLFWPTTRSRSPMDFVFMFYSACAISDFWTSRLNRPPV